MRAHGNAVPLAQGRESGVVVLALIHVEEPSEWLQCAGLPYPWQETC
jgi:hypothetical protein